MCAFDLSFPGGLEVLLVTWGIASGIRRHTKSLQKIVYFRLSAMHLIKKFWSIT